MRLIPTNRPDAPYLPKYVPQISEFCASCGTRIKFAVQTKELVEEFNEALKTFEIFPEASTMTPEELSRYSSPYGKAQVALEL